MPEPTPDSAHTPPDSFWRSVGQALRGESHDYTSVPLNRAVLLLAVPMVLEMVMESLFAITDVFWVSRLGKEAIAVVGITETVMTLIYSIAIGISFAATAIVARRIGEKDPARAAQAAGQIIMIGTTISAGLGVVLSFYAAEIMQLMGADATVVEQGTRFAQIMLGGNITVFMIFLVNAIFRGAGDAALAMRTLWLANGLNIILDPCFIMGWGPFPEMGVTGAAVATNLGRGIGLCYQIWHLTMKPGHVQVRWADLLPQSKTILTILKTSGNGIAQLLIATISWVVLMKILAPFGSHVIAGYTISIRIIMFALMPAWGLANAGSTLVGQNLGASKPDRAEAAVKIATRYNVILLGSIGMIFIIFAHPLISIFTTDPDVSPQAVHGLLAISLAFPLYAGGICLQAAFNGSGDTWTPTRLNFFCFMLGQAPLAWLLAGPLALGPLGVYIAVPVSFSALTIWSAVLFKAGKWKQQKV